MALTAPEAARRPNRSAVSAGLGLLAGLAMDGALRASYPPGKHMGWVPGAIAGGSALIVALGYLALAYHDRRLIADPFVIGYLGAVVLAAGLEVGYETLAFLRVKAPGLVGVLMRPMSPALTHADAIAWFAAACAVLIGASYLLWCLGRLPRTRLLLLLAGVLCLGVAVDLHGYLLGSQVTPAPPLPPGAQQ